MKEGSNLVQKHHTGCNAGLNIAVPSREVPPQQDTPTQCRQVLMQKAAPSQLHSFPLPPVACPYHVTSQQPISLLLQMLSQLAHSLTPHVQSW